MVQWLQDSASTGGHTGSIPGWGTWIPQTMWPKRVKRTESNFSKTLLVLMIHFIKTFLAAPQGMWDLGVPPTPQTP